MGPLVLFLLAEEYAAKPSATCPAMRAITDGFFRTLWTAGQRTTEFPALIGPRGRRVLVDTDIPNGQCPLENTTDDVVWRNAQTGDELARTEEPLPVMTSGTMIQPYYFGKTFYVASMANSSSWPSSPLPPRAIEKRRRERAQTP